jgi:hypothetical protein
MTNDAPLLRPTAHMAVCSTPVHSRVHRPQYLLWSLAALVGERAFALETGVAENFEMGCVQKSRPTDILLRSLFELGII